MAAIKYKKDRAADTILPNYYEYGHFDVPSYYESYWQSPEERFYTALFIIQILCLVVAFFLLFTSVGLIYGAHTFSRYLIYPWFPCMIASILCSLTYCIIWWTGDVRDYWLVLTILEMIGVFINLYCLVAIIIFTRQMNSMREYYKENKMERFDSLNGKYNEYRGDNYNQFNRLSELDYPVKPSKGFGTLRDEYNRLPDQAPEYYNQAPMSYQHFDGPPRPARYDESSRPINTRRNRFDLENDYDDMTSKWVKEQQVIGLEDHANSEPASPTKEPFPILQHSLSVPSMYAETSGGITCPYHCHKSHHHHHRSRHRSRDHDRRSSSHRHGKRHRHRSSSIGSRSRRSYSSSSGSSIYTDDSYRHRHRSRSRHLYSDDGTDVTDDSRITYKRHRRSSKKDRDYEYEKRGPRHVKRTDRERGSRSSLNVALNQENTGAPVGSPIDHLDQEWQNGVPQGTITIPQHIIIPPSAGTLGPDNMPQPQTYQINSEIRISYDQQGRPIVPEASVINPRPTIQSQPQIQRTPPANSSSVMGGKLQTQVFFTLQRLCRLLPKGL
uniref:MARVEL domain-containing protein n=1 Tax=Syphacia muris TaxID=451379 RepID=A0A0N5ALS9_9BILA